MNTASKPASTLAKTLAKNTAYLDWPFFDETHRTLSADLHAWAAENIDPHHAKDVDAACQKLVRQLGTARANDSQQGGQRSWLSYAVSGTEYGGNADTIDTRAICLIRETLAQYSGLADFAFAMQGLGSGAISLHGTPAQKTAYLPDVAAGRKIAAFALSEKDAGSDVAAMACSAVLSDDGTHYVLNGEKTWISNGGIADFYVVFARTGEAAGSRGISAFIVDAGTSEQPTAGFEIAERIHVIAPHPLATLRFTNCHIPASQLLGEAGQGFKVAMATLDIFRTSVAAAALGFSRRALDEALHRATTRKMFGGVLADFQLTQAKLADMAVGVETSALLVYKAAWQRDQGKNISYSITQAAAMAKLHATETAQHVIDAAVQMFGGQGVVADEPVESLYREIRALRIYEGASEVQQMIIARELLKNMKDKT